MTKKIIKLYENPLKRMPFSLLSRDTLTWTDVKARTLQKAFEISINKWQIIVNNELIEYDGSTSTCGLCHLYWNKPDCGTCPVAKSGHVLCEGSPYDAWRMNQTTLNAQAERDFLIQVAAERGYTIEYVPEVKEE